MYLIKKNNRKSTFSRNNYGRIQMSTPGTYGNEFYILKKN